VAKLRNMKALLIYDNGEQYEPDFKIEEFDSKEKMIEFINEKNVGEGVIAAYEFYKEVEIEPFERVVNYKLK